MLSPFERLEHILEDGQVYIWQVYVPTGEMTRNHVLPRVIGCDDHELGSRQDSEGWTRRVHPADLPTVQSRRQQLFAGKIDSYSVDYRVRRDKGGWATLRSRVHIVERDEFGKPLWVSGLIIDVSGEKELDRRMHAVFDRPFQFIGLLTPGGVVVEINRSRLFLSEFNASDVVGRNFWDLPLFANSAELKEKVRTGIEKAAAGEPVRFEIVENSGTENAITVDFTLAPLRDDDGNVVNIIPEARDISDLTKAREARREAEQRLNIAIQAANIGLWDMGLPNGPIWFSDHWLPMLGYGPGEVEASTETLQTLMHADDRARVRSAIAQQQDAGESRDFDIEFRLRSKAGPWRWIQARGQGIANAPGGRGYRVSGVFMDVTDRRESEQRLATAERLESIGQLAAGVAHEINTPVQYVSDSVYFIREGIEELLGHLAKPPGNPEHSAVAVSDLSYLKQNLLPAVDRAMDGLARIAEIVSSMSCFAHPDAQEMSPVDLNRGIQSTLIVAKNVYKLVADVESEFSELPLVTCHGGQINQVVLNLLVNAAHAISDVVKDSQARGKITVKTHQEGPEAVICISDTGGGIPESIRDRIFEPFFTTKEVGRGTGQGLSIARSVIVQGHHGTLSFQTETGRGTTFFVRLPIDPLASTAAAA